jgi:hypothetical protein
VGVPDTHSFREGELRSLLEMHGLKDVPVRWTRDNDPEGIDSAFMEVELPSDVSVHTCNSLCRHGSTHNALSHTHGVVSGVLLRTENHSLRIQGMFQSGMCVRNQNQMMMES